MINKKRNATSVVLFPPDDVAGSVSGLSVLRMLGISGQIPFQVRMN